MQHTKKYEVQEFLFETILSKYSALGHVDLKIITDRETVIFIAIKTGHPNIKLFYCKNNLQRYVRYWLKKKIIILTTVMKKYTKTIFGICWIAIVKQYKPLFNKIFCIEYNI